MNANIEGGPDLMTSRMTISAMADIQPLTTRRRLTSEEELFVAVLEDAVICFQKYVFARDPRGRELFLDAEAWIMSNANEALFSFTSVCDHLGVSPGYLRQSLLEWRKQVALKRKRRSTGGVHKKAA